MQLDTAIGDDDGTGGGNTRLGLFDEADGMDEASVVPPRIENDGPGLDVVRTHGHPPCGTPEGLPVCGAAG